MSCSLPWPAPQLDLVVADIRWQLLLDDPISVDKDLIILSAADSDPIRKSAAHLSLLSSIIPTETPWNADAPPFPFLFYGKQGFSSRFKGIGTNSIEHAKKFCLFSLAGFFWNKAITLKLGSEHMVRNLSYCIKCLSIVGKEKLTSVLGELDPDVGHTHMFLLCEVVLDLCKYNVSTKPPAECTKQQLLEAISMLNICMLKLQDGKPISRFNAFSKKLEIFITNELYFNHGVYIYKFLELPFSNVPKQQYTNVKDTARLYVESYACLVKTKCNSLKYKTEIRKKMDSGYAHEYRGEPTYCPRVTTHDALQKRVPITLLSAAAINGSKEESVKKVLHFSSI